MIKVYNVLILEDDLHSAELVVRLLEKYNLWVTHCDNARKAFQKVKEVKFDIILCDIMMPAIDGFSFLEKAEKDIKNIPIIMLTAVKEKQTVIKAVNLKVAAYIIKPFDKKELIAKMIEALKIKEFELIQLKDYPLDIKLRETNNTKMEIIVSGIPEAKQLQSLEDHFRKLKDDNPKISNLEINIAEEFGYPMNNIQNAELLVNVISKGFRLSSSFIVLKGPYSKSLALMDLPGDSILRDCRKYEI